MEKRSPEFFKDRNGGVKKRTADHAAANWNSRYSGTRVLGTVDGSGHLVGRIFDKRFYAHRVVFALVNGAWPQNYIDHINGDPADNRPKNLRDVTHQENHKNQKSRKNNTSGTTGVSFNHRLNKWHARMTADGQDVHIGFFDDKKEAVKARIEAQKSAGFHKNHGRKAA